LTVCQDPVERSFPLTLVELPSDSDVRSAMEQGGSGADYLLANAIIIRYAHLEQEPDAAARDRPGALLMSRVTDRITGLCDRR
jgi:hypothetical protein